MISNKFIKYATLKYITNKKKAITVYFLNKVEAWFEIHEVSTLFGATGEKIDEVISQIPKK
ncbi:MAG: hypothetical protein LBL90_12100 [Prevotellaceae bacterium]|jgi:hypothetical protein|nr:hypothetical protein [Prevotellaceae bacterium]